VLARLTRESELRTAVEQSLLEVHYQPIVDLDSGRVRSIEALARWPDGWPSIPPSDFIPIAEECGLIAPLGRQVLRTAVAMLAKWRKLGIVEDDTCVSVNISPRQLDSAMLPDEVLAALSESGLPPHLLLLEITESTLMLEPERIGKLVSDICAEGVGLHLDDFGTGYSSLTALLQFPVQALKIDRSFVNPGDADRATNEAIVRSTIALAQSLELEVIAEGLETRGQLESLRTLGCDCGQGYLLSRPLPAKAAGELLARWDPSDSLADWRKSGV
jgi:EAL domain-containing protein (putative c-di-GMP-specific phosphodiesterase class I)